MPLPGFDPRTVQPLPSGYTDCTASAHLCSCRRSWPSAWSRRMCCSVADVAIAELHEGPHNFKGFVRLPSYLSAPHMYFLPIIVRCCNRPEMPCSRSQIAPWAEGTRRPVLPVLREGDAQQGAEGAALDFPQGHAVPVRLETQPRRSGRRTGTGITGRRLRWRRWRGLVRASGNWC